MDLNEFQISVGLKNLRNDISNLSIILMRYVDESTWDELPNFADAFSNIFLLIEAAETEIKNKMGKTR